MIIIDVKNLRRAFGKAVVLEDVSLRVEAGGVYGLVGLNGAGKTTLIRVLLGLIGRDEGSVEIAGFDPWRHEAAFYRTVGVALESDGFFGNLTVRENLRIFAGAKGVSQKDADRYLEEYWGGTDIFCRGDRLQSPAPPRKVKHLSRGQRVQCGLCRAFLGWPSVYFFDEPVVSLDFLAYEHFKTMVGEAKSRGAAVLISSHQLEVIDDLCDRVGILKGGRLDEVNRQSQKFSDTVKSIYRGDN
jgi:ABC-type multidrug transport system ATPase subunit